MCLQGFLRLHLQRKRGRRFRSSFYNLVECTTTSKHTASPFPRLLFPKESPRFPLRRRHILSTCYLCIHKRDGLIPSLSDGFLFPLIHFNSIVSYKCWGGSNYLFHKNNRIPLIWQYDTLITFYLLGYFRISI